MLFYSIDNQAYEVLVKDGESRAISPSETEPSIVGPHDAFVESIETNLSLIRKKVISTKLQ
jgi:spore germination protein KA